jgi:hypothetical protein
MAAYFYKTKVNVYTVDGDMTPVVIFKNTRGHELEPADPKPPISLWWKPDMEHYDPFVSSLTSQNSLYVRPIIDDKAIVPELDENSEIRTIFENLFVDIDFPTVSQRAPFLKAA